MTNLLRKSGAALALLASVSLAATPAMARGWGGGWGRHHDRDVDAGDVITGILIIGGIAAIASAASSENKRERERREREEREARDYRYEPQADTRGYTQGDERPIYRESSGINAAIERCVGEIERGSSRVEEVETVGKQGNAWRIEGRMQGGESFACTIDRDLRIRSVSVGGEAY